MRSEFLIKNGILKVLILFFLVGCTLASREVFDLHIQEQQLINTLRIGPYLSIADDGLFDQLNHSAWDFDIDNMEVAVYDITPTGTNNRFDYSLEIIEGSSAIEGILRLYGSGPYNNKFIGISGLTNLHGAFLKFSAQDGRDKAIANARDKPNWYVSKPIIFRLTTTRYKDKKIVSLDDEEFFNKKEHNYFTPGIIEGGIGVEDTRTLEERKEVNGGTTRTLDDVELIDTVLIPPNNEIYTVEIAGATKYWGIEFSSKDTKMRIVKTDTFDDAKFKLDELDKPFNYDLEENAKINNKSIRFLKDHKMVLLTKPGAATDPKAGEYYWDKTDELIFDPDTMKLKVITTFNIYDPTTPFGATNTFNYDIVMKVAKGDRAGIFTIKGDGRYKKFDNKWGVLNVIEYTDPDPDGTIGTIKIFADLELLDLVTPTDKELEDLLDDIIADTNFTYQNRATVTLPYRLAINLQSVGVSWEQLQENSTGSMYYDDENTEKYRFLSITDRELQYISVTPENTSESFYKVKVVRDYNDTNGVFLLRGYTDDNFKVLDPNAPMDGQYLAIERGAELHKTQAKYGVGKLIEDAIEKRDNAPLFNLHESRALVPSDNTVILVMEKLGEWVAQTYTGENLGIIPDPLPVLGTIPNYNKDETEIWRFDTDPEAVVFINSITTTTTTETDGTVTVTVTRSGEAKYRLEAQNEVTAASGVFQLRLLKDAPLAGATDYSDQYVAIQVGIGDSGHKASIAIRDNQADAEEELARIYNNTTGKFYTHQTLDSMTDAILENLEDFGTMAQMELVATHYSTGVYNPAKTKLLSFNASAKLLTVKTTADKGVVYNITIISGTSSNNEVVLFLTGSGGLWNDHFMYIKLIDGDKGIFVVHQSKGSAKTIFDNINDTKKRDLPYSYWTHERLASLEKKFSVQDDFMKLLDDETRILTGITNDATGKEDIYGTPKYEKYKGLAMLADTNFYRTTTIVNGATTSRVKIGLDPSGEKTNNTDWGGYFDPEDTYIFTIGTEHNEIKIKRTYGNITGTYRLKLLKQENNKVASFLILRGVNAAGDPLSDDPELDTSFLNKVISIDLGDENQYGVHIGFSKLEDYKGDVSEAIKQAKQDRKDKLSSPSGSTGQYIDKSRKYSPLLVPRAIAEASHIGPKIISGNVPRVFIDKDGFEVPDDRGDNSFYKSGQAGGQLSVTFHSGTDERDGSFGPSSQYYMEVALKPHESIGKYGKKDDIHPGLQTTKLLMKVLKVTVEADLKTGERSITTTFKLHRPDTKYGSSLPNYGYYGDWFETIYDKVYVLRVGTGVNLLNHKWAMADKVDGVGGALQQVKDMKFWNGTSHSASLFNEDKKDMDGDGPLFSLFRFAGYTDTTDPTSGTLGQPVITPWRQVYFIRSRPGNPLLSEFKNMYPDLISLGALEVIFRMERYKVKDKEIYTNKYYMEMQPKNSASGNIGGPPEEYEMVLKDSKVERYSVPKRTVAFVLKKKKNGPEDRNGWFFYIRPGTGGDSEGLFVKPKSGYDHEQIANAFLYRKNNTDYGAFSFTTPNVELTRGK